MRAWLADVTARGDWMGGVGSWFGSSMLESSPFNTPWRRDQGALWDIAPHVISLLWASLGPVTSVIADAGLADVSHLILHHQGGPTSTVTVSQSAARRPPGSRRSCGEAPAGRSRLRRLLIRSRRCGRRWASSPQTFGRAGLNIRVMPVSAGTWATSSPRLSARSTSAAKPGRWDSPRGPRPQIQ